MAHYVVGIDAAASGLKTAVLDANLRGVELKRADTTPWRLAEVPAPDHPYEDSSREIQLAKQMADACNALQLAGAELFMGWDGTKAATRVMSFPITDLRKIETMLDFELEDQLARGIEDMVYAHLPVVQSKEKTDILAVTTERAPLRSFIDASNSLGRGPRGVFLTSFSLLAIAGELHNGLVVDIGHTKTEVLVIAGGKPLFSRTLREGGRRVDQALARAMNSDEATARVEKERIGEITEAIATGLKPLVLGLKQTLMTYRPQLGDTPSVHITGGMAYLRGIERHLMRELGIDTRQLVLPRQLQALPDGHRYSMAYALAMTGSLSARHPKLDFRVGELSFRGDLSGLRSQGQRWAIGAAILLALAFTSGITRYLVLRSDELKLDDSLKSVTKTMMGREMSDFKQAITAIRQSVNPEKSVLPKYSALEYLGVLSQRITSETDVKLSEIEIRQDKILLKGDGASFEMVDKVVEALKGHECFKAVVPGKTRKSIDGSRIEFSAQIDLSCGSS